MSGVGGDYVDVGGTGASEMCRGWTPVSASVGMRKKNSGTSWLGNVRRWGEGVRTERKRRMSRATTTTVLSIGRTAD